MRAAGGVVWRRAGTDGLEVLLVHRPKYDDWSLPKGKCGDGEDDLACALREVEEETGLACRPGPELPTTEYRDPRGRPKHVRYWAMAPAGGAFEADDEVDEVQWLPLEGALDRLDHVHDRQVVEALPPALEG